MKPDGCFLSCVLSDDTAIGAPLEIHDEILESRDDTVRKIKQLVPYASFC